METTRHAFQTTEHSVADKQLGRISFKITKTNDSMHHIPNGMF